MLIEFIAFDGSGSGGEDEGSDGIYLEESSDWFPHTSKTVSEVNCFEALTLMISNVDVYARPTG
jgi:hypothetical protein